jgi:hypothetical protein
VLKLIRAARPTNKRLSLARVKKILREQYLLVRLDEERAVSALPKLLGENAAARKTALDILHRVLAARGDMSNEGERRLARVEALFNGGPDKTVKMEIVHG